MLTQPHSSQTSVPADTRMLDVSLVRSLIDESRFHAALSYFTTRALPPWRLHDLHEILQACFQSLLIEGRGLAVEMYADSELKLIQGVKTGDPEWIDFTEWVARDYGTSNLGPILYPINFCHDEAFAFITTTLKQDCTLKDILALLCISQVTQCAPTELTELALRFLGNPGLKIFCLRCLSEWASLMRGEDQNLINELIRRTLRAATDRNEFLTAAYILEKVSAAPASRYQLALSAIEKAEIGELDTYVTDQFHVYVLRYLSRQQLTELKTFASRPRWRANMFRESLLLCLDAWLHIKEQDLKDEPIMRVVWGFSEYLAALTQRLFPGSPVMADGASDVPMSLSDPQIDLLRHLCQGGSSTPHDGLDGMLAALTDDTAQLELR
jgi:hypothetical protein